MKSQITVPKGRISFPDMPKKSEEFDKNTKYVIDIESDVFNGRTGYYYTDEANFYFDYPYTWDNLYYPGLQYLNLMMYDDLVHNMRMCRKLRDFLKPVSPSNDLWNSACYPMGIPEPRIYWTPWEQMTDDMFKRNKVINAINRAYRSYQFNINSTYGKLR